MVTSGPLGNPGPAFLATVLVVAGTLGIVRSPFDFSLSIDNTPPTTTATQRKLNMTDTPMNLPLILESHRKWALGLAEGVRADLSGANLFGAHLSGANLSGANLSRADLQGANLSVASLSVASLSGANLSRANLFGANLSRANLSGANLFGADLSGANLFGAHLSGANLFGADLSGANLSGAHLFGATNMPTLAVSITRILPAGDIIGWKKCQHNVIVKLKIPAKAKRSHAFGRKCRAEYAKVLDVIGGAIGISSHDGKTKYKKGATVRPDSFSDEWQDECAPGIHFFITREEAEAY